MCKLDVIASGSDRCGNAIFEIGIYFNKIDWEILRDEPNTLVDLLL